MIRHNGTVEAAFAERLHHGVHIQVAVFDQRLLEFGQGAVDIAEVDLEEPALWSELADHLDGSRAGGRAAIVIKNTFLSNTDNASVSLRKQLLESCNLHTVLDCPGGTFLGAGVKTVVLFFEKGAPTRKVWYYQLDPGRNMGKTNPLNDADLAEFVELQKTFTTKVLEALAPGLEDGMAVAYAHHGGAAAPARGHAPGAALARRCSSACRVRTTDASRSRRPAAPESGRDLSCIFYRLIVRSHGLC